MKVSSWLRCIPCALLVCSLAVLAGCDEGPDTDEVNGYDFADPGDWSSLPRTSPSGAKPVLTPSSAELTYDGATLALQVSGGTAPFTWSVHDIALGTVAESTDGRTAVYERNAKGDNAVVVRDRNGEPAYCTIAQE